MGNALPCFRPSERKEGLQQAPQPRLNGPGAFNGKAGGLGPADKASAECDGSAAVVTAGAAVAGGPHSAKATGAGGVASPSTKATPAAASTTEATDAAVPGASAKAPAGNGHLSDSAEAAPHTEPDAPALMDTLLSTFASTDGFPYQPYDAGPCTTEDEQSRLQALRAINLLGNVTNPGGLAAKLDEEINALLSTVMQLFQTNTAMLALFEGGQVRVRNSLGIQSGVFPWRWSFCGYTLSMHTPKSLVVHDALTDGRFCDNVFVTSAPFVRFYCGAPLVSSAGHILGTLCVTDSTPRPEFDAGAARLMNNLAELMVRQLERHKLGTAAAQADGETTALARVARTLDCYEAPIGLVDVAVQSGWVLMYANEAWEAAVQRSREQLVGRTLQSMFSAGQGGAAVAAQAGGQQGEEQQQQQQDQPIGQGQGPEGTGADSANGGVVGASEAAAGLVAGASAPVGNGSGARLSGGGMGSGAESELWVTVQRALLSGEAVDVGRVRSLGESGRRLGPPLLMQIRPANSHVLDAATRMPVGIPPELERQAELVRQSMAGVDPSAAQPPATATAPDGDTPAEAAAGAAGQSGALEAASGSLTVTSGAAGAREPCYCFVLLAPLPPEQQLLEEDEEEEEEEEDEFGKTMDWCVPGGEVGAPSATGAGPLVETFPAEALGNSASLRGALLSLQEPPHSTSGPFTAALRPASATDGTPASHLHERLSKHLPPFAASEHSLDANGRTAGYDSPMTVAGNVVAAALQGMHSGGYAAAGSGSGAGPRAIAGHSPSHSSRGGGVRNSKNRITTFSHAHTSSHTAATPRAANLHGSGRGPAARAGGGGGAMPTGADWAYGMEPLPGLRLGHMLGKGGYGRVWEAQYKGRRVAAKVVSNSMLRAVSVVNGVTLEVLMAQELHHPHVVRTYKCVVRSFENAAGSTPFALPSLGAGTASTSGATAFGRSREPSTALPGAGSGPAPSVRGRLSAATSSPLPSPPPPPMPAVPCAVAGQPAPASADAGGLWPPQQQQLSNSAGGAAARRGNQEGGQADVAQAGGGDGPLAAPRGNGGAGRLEGSAGRIGPRQFSANWPDGEGPMDSFEAEASAAGWNMIDDLAEDPFGRSPPTQPQQPSQQHHHAPSVPSAPPEPPAPSSPSPEPTFTATTQIQALADTLSGPPSDASLEPSTPFATSLYPHGARTATGTGIQAAPSIDLSPPFQRPSAAAVPSTTAPASASHPGGQSSMAITNSQPSNANSSAANNNIASNVANNNSSAGATHRLSVSSTSAAASHPFRIGDGGNSYSVVGASMQHYPHPSGVSTTGSRTTTTPGMASSVLPGDGRLPTSSQGQAHNPRTSAETGSQAASGETGAAASGGGVGATCGGGAAGGGSVNVTGVSASSCMGPVIPEGETWILQEFCSRGTLQDAVDRGLLRTDISRVRGLPCLPVILMTALEIASAMAYLHASGYMHGDLSAVNVLLTDSHDSTPEGAAPAPRWSSAGAPSTEASTGPAGGSVVLQRLQRGWVAKVSDFGLAKHVPGGPNGMHISSSFGVITHTAPETLKSYIQTQASDVYSFGVLMWQMWTSSRPWANMNRFQIMSAVTNPTGPGLRFTPIQMPPKRYHRLAMRCLSYEPSARPTFAEAVSELQDMLDNLPDMEEAAAAPGRGMGAGTAAAAAAVATAGAAEAGKPAAV